MKRQTLLLATVMLLAVPIFVFTATTTTEALEQFNLNTTGAETLYVPFTAGIPGVTTVQSYSGPVLVTASGIGQAAGDAWSDAFYIYTTPSGEPWQPWHPNQWVLWINGGPSDNWVNPIPSYSATHVYSFVVNAIGGPLTFSVGDTGTFDNTGGYTITVGQQPGPTPTNTLIPGATATHTATAGGDPTQTSTVRPTATPTATPEGWHLVEMRNGIGDYDGTTDTWINGWSQGTNYGTMTTMDVRSGEWMHSLIRFDLSDIPGDAIIVDATLKLWTTGRSNALPIDIDVHQLYVPWDETAATWITATSTTPWLLPGASDPREYSPVRLDRSTVGAVDTWNYFSVGLAVRDWLANSTSNHGLILRSQTAYGIEYVFTTSEHLSKEVRPRLQVLYYWRPYGKLTLQRGLNGYDGVTDTWIDEWRPTQNLNVGTESLFVKVYTNGSQNGLFRFDLSEIPVGAIVRDAQLEMRIGSRSNTNTLVLDAFRLVRAWDDDEATWEQADATNAWEIAGAAGPSDRSLVPEGQLVLNTGDLTWVSCDLTSLVQYWVDHPAENDGFLLRGRSGGGVQYTLRASDHPEQEDRPKLIIRYTTPEPTSTPIPTPTATDTATTEPTLTPTATPTATVTIEVTSTPTATVISPPRTLVLQFGKDGYTSSSDTHISAWTPYTNYGSEPLLKARTKDYGAALVRFNVASHLPADATVLQAWLELYAVSRTSTDPVELQVYPLVREWNANQANWYRARVGEDWGDPGANDTATDCWPMPAATQVASIVDQWISFDLTTLVQHWQHYPEMNLGVAVRAVGDTDVEYSFYSNEYQWSIALHPRLIITYQGGSQPPEATATPTRTHTPEPTPTATRLSQMALPLVIK